MNTFEWTSSVIGVTAAVINLGALIFIGMQLRHAITESRQAALAQEEERLRQRKRDTIEAMVASTQHRAKLKSGLPWNDRNADEVRLFLDQVEEDPSKRSAVREYLDYLEALAVGVTAGVFDVETIARMSGGRILAVASNYASYIDRRRAELNSSTVYAEFEAMAELVRQAGEKPASALTTNVHRGMTRRSRCWTPDPC